MSTSLLYHTCGDPRVFLDQDGIRRGDGLVSCRGPTASLPLCDLRLDRCDPPRQPQPLVSQRAFGRKLTWIIAELPRLECKRCGALRQIEVALLNPAAATRKPSSSTFWTWRRT